MGKTERCCENKTWQDPQKKSAALKTDLSEKPDRFIINLYSNLQTELAVEGVFDIDFTEAISVFEGTVEHASCRKRYLEGFIDFVFEARSDMYLFILQNYILKIVLLHFIFAKGISPFGKKR